jgi:osmotically-inducible protein OsmY
MAHVTAKTDETLRRNVLNQLGWDARIDAASILAEVYDGTVILKGVLPTYAQVQLAEKDALSVPGIDAVENRIEIGRPAPAANTDDRVLESNIRDLIRFNSAIDESRIIVVAAGGRVILEGTVDSFWQKARVESLAAETRGVMDIDNRIAVVPAEKKQDSEIARDISAAFVRNMSIDPNLINISVGNGAVTISGSVPDKVAFRAAEEIARFTPGVVKVTNDLVIEYPRQE